MTAAEPPEPSTGARLELTALRRRFGDTTAVDALSLPLEPGSFTALLGPSGCGKSTVLRLIAGLLDPDGGDVRLDGRSLLQVPAERRAVGLVFQKPLLFPQLTVEANVAFGLRMRGIRRQAARSTAGQMLERVKLSGLAGRRVGELSGGQEQRVALARALVLSPRVLLLDEPFSQLDAALRAEMRVLVRELTREAALTTVFVTHDQAEAVEVSDRIALLLQGRLEGHDAPESFYTQPPSLPAARFFGVTNEIPGRVTSGCFVSDDGLLEVPSNRRDGPAVLVVRPEALALDAGAIGGPGESGGADGLCLSGVAAAARFAGTHLQVDVEIAGGRTIVAHAPVGTPVELGARVLLTARPSAWSVLPDQT